MYDNFFSQVNSKKYFLFKYLCTNPYKNYLLDDICQYLGEESTTIKRYISDLNRELSTLNNSEEVIIKQFTKQVYGIENSHYIKLKESLKHYYLEQSNTFVLCKIICLNKPLSINQLLHKTSIGRTNLYKTINSLNKLLSKFSLSIKKDEQGNYFLSGDELIIRLFQFSFYSRCFQKTEWLFPFSEKFINSQISQSVSSEIKKNHLKKDLIRISGLLYRRFEQNNYLHSELNEISLFSRLKDNERKYFIEKIKKISNNKKSLLIRAFFTDERIADIEQAAYYFFIIFLFPELKDENFYKEQGKEIFNLKSPFISFTKAVCDVGITQFNVNLEEEKYYEIFYILHLHILLFMMFKSVSYEFLVEITPCLQEKKTLNNYDVDFMSKKECSIYLELTKNSACFDDFFSGYKIPDCNLLISYVSKVIYQYLIMLTPFKNKKFKLYLEFEKNYIGERFYINWIRDVFSSSILLIDDIEEADIIVHDSEERIGVGHNDIYISNVFDLDIFNECMSKLNGIVLKNILIDL